MIDSTSVASGPPIDSAKVSKAAGGQDPMAAQHRLFGAKELQNRSKRYQEVSDISLVTNLDVHEAINDYMALAEHKKTATENPYKLPSHLKSTLPPLMAKGHRHPIKKQDTARMPVLSKSIVAKTGLELMSMQQMEEMRSKLQS